MSGPHEWCANTSLLMEKNSGVVLKVLVDGGMAGHGPLPGGFAWWAASCATPPAKTLVCVPPACLCAIWQDSPV